MPNIKCTKIDLFLDVLMLIALMTLGCRSYQRTNGEHVGLTWINGSDGVRYELVANYSIQQMTNSAIEEERHRENFILGLCDHFPENKELNTYLEQLKMRYRDMNLSYLSELKRIQDDLEKSGGELYFYKVFAPNSNVTAVNQYNSSEVKTTDEGLLILVNGKIYNKY